MKSLKISLLCIASAISLITLVACANPIKEEMTSHSTMNSESSEAVSSSTDTISETSSSSSQQPSELDGTYKGRKNDEEITLVIQGEAGTWTEVEADGEQEVKAVSVETVNQRMIIGDDVRRYMIEGNQLTIEDISERDFDDTVVLTKQ